MSTFRRMYINVFKQTRYKFLYTGTTPTSLSGFNFRLTDTEKEIQEKKQENIQRIYLRKRAWSLGFLTGHIPEHAGGQGQNILTSCMIDEEFSYGCTGISTALTSPGLAEQNMGQRANDTRAVTFEDVRVPKENILTGEDAGFKIAMETFDLTRPNVAACATGLIQRCLDEASTYANERKTFGVPIAQHQAVAFLLSEMGIAVELSRLAWIKGA